MAQNTDYRKYLEECFKNVRENFTEVKDSLKDINNHLKDLNNKVVEHEKYIVYADNAIKIRGDEASEIKKDIKEIKTDLEEYRFFKKYPKLFLYALVGFILLTAFTVWSSINTTQNQNDIESRIRDLGTPVVTDSFGRPYSRGFSIKMYPKDFIDTTINQK